MYESKTNNELILSTVGAILFLVTSTFIKGMQNLNCEKIEKSQIEETTANEVDKKTMILKDRIAVNYHFTRQCNYDCGFCFHTAKTSHIEKEEDAKKIIMELRKAGFRKINFAGGEPFLHAKLLGKLVQYAKKICGYESVSIISNGSKIKREWFEENGEFLDILGISCDSIDEEINKKIGRGKGDHLQHVRNAAQWCKLYNVQFKLNTVVNKSNCHTYMSALIQ